MRVYFSVLLPVPRCSPNSVTNPAESEFSCQVQTNPYSLAQQLLGLLSSFDWLSVQTFKLRTVNYRKGNFVFTLEMYINLSKFQSLQSLEIYKCMY